MVTTTPPRVRKFVERGHRLRELRESVGMTGGEVAEALGVSQAAVSQWEIGKHAPARHLLPALAALYNVTTDELLGREVMRPATPEEAEVIRLLRKAEPDIKDAVYLLLKSRRGE